MKKLMAAALLTHSALGLACVQEVRSEFFCKNNLGQNLTIDVRLTGTLGKGSIVINPGHAENGTFTVSMDATKRANMNKIETGSKQMHGPFGGDLGFKFYRDVNLYQEGCVDLGNGQTGLSIVSQRVFDWGDTLEEVARSFEEKYVVFFPDQNHVRIDFYKYHNLFKDQPVIEFTRQFDCTKVAN